MATRTTTAGTREIEGRDSVGLYLDEIARNPLLDAAAEVELSKTIEAGLMAENLLAEGRVRRLPIRIRFARPQPANRPGCGIHPNLFLLKFFSGLVVWSRTGARNRPDGKS